MRFSNALRFESREMDAFLLQWLHSGLNAAEQREVSHILLYDAKFREGFCEFVKSLRDELWADKKEGKK